MRFLKKFQLFPSVSTEQHLDGKSVQVQRHWFCVGKLHKILLQRSHGEGFHIQMVLEGQLIKKILKKITVGFEFFLGVQIVNCQG